jgi:uncharacterized damage-inducible protein DinB
MDTDARIATVAALWAAFEARDWAGARQLLADDATMTWHTSGERMLDADAMIRVNATYPEGWTVRVLALNALQDGRVHSIVEVTHPPARFIANSLFGLEGGRIVQVDEYWSTVEAPPAWRTAETIGAYQRYVDVPSSPPADSPLRGHLATLASYNLWATRKLLDHVDAMPEADYRRDAGLFFKSVHGTLNHLLVGEHLLWFRRFVAQESPKVLLNAEVEPDRDRLRERLVAGAQAWAPFIADCDAARFGGTLDYTTTQGVAQSLPFAATLAHVFNHATHHRGQISAAITAMGHPCPEIDMVRMLQSESASS